MGFGYNVVKMNGMKRVHGIQSDRLRKAIFVFRLEADAYMYICTISARILTYLLISTLEPNNKFAAASKI